MKNIFIFVGAKTFEKDHVNKEIKNHYLDAQFIVIDELTEGQAATCLFAKDEINNNEELIIGACDNGMIWEEKVLFEKNEADCMVWSFRNNVTVS